MTYYYPNNLSSQTLFAKYWTGKDLTVILTLFVLAVLNVIVFSGFWLFICLLIYAFFSAKIANGYSITKLLVLYIKFLFTDILVYFWRCS